MRKMKYIRVKKACLLEKLQLCTLMSHSIQDANLILKEFNLLSYERRITVAQEYRKLEETLQNNMKTQDENMYLMCMMVNLNVIAAGFDIDPATVCLCVTPICKLNEKIMVI